MEAKIDHVVGEFAYCQYRTEVGDEWDVITGVDDYDPTHAIRNHDAYLVARSNNHAYDLVALLYDPEPYDPPTT